VIVVVDTGAMVGLVDADDRHHATLKRLFANTGDGWVLPWAILPEVDYLLRFHVGDRASQAFLADLADGVFAVEWGEDSDLVRASELCKRHRALAPGMVDAAVVAVAERLNAAAIATHDLRDFSAMVGPKGPRIWPRDWSGGAR